jgi:hypothetical protein
MTEVRKEDRGKIGAMKGVFALRAYQPRACRVYPPAALPKRRVMHRRTEAFGPVHLENVR